MPHLHLEYSDNLQHIEIKPLLVAIHQAIFKAGHVSDPNDLKSRAIMQQDYMIGLNLVTDQAYVHAKVSLLSGRSVEGRQAIFELVLDVMQQYIAPQPELKIQLCVEIIEMPKQTYSKASI
ncbi:5-carboxymethyl-2-hydroxymuconate isomerase [Acinetobacter lwoffii]|uniref:5-carboxymethyl-2-hydroxymuconate Delta-isomerase n=1 Tax=Acinetobacter lwoffii TaxID=28090 RepID=UPI00300952D0